MITIQSFENQDTDQIVNLILNIQQNEFQVPITINEQQDLLNIPSFYQHGKGNFWVAKSKFLLILTNFHQVCKDDKDD